MSEKKKPAPKEAAPLAAEQEPVTPQWSPAELLAVAHLGPAIIGREMHAAAQAYVAKHGANALGPATRGE